MLLPQIGMLMDRWKECFMDIGRMVPEVLIAKRDQIIERQTLHSAYNIDQKLCQRYLEKNKQLEKSNPATLRQNMRGDFIRYGLALKEVEREISRRGLG